MVRLSLGMSEFYTIIPSGVLSNQDLNPTQKIILSVVMTLSQKSGHCWASNGTLSKNLGIGRSTIKRGIKKLEDMGYIKIQMEFNDGDTKRKILPTPMCKNLYQGGSKMNQGVVQNEPGGGSKMNPNNTSVILQDDSTHLSSTIGGQNEPTSLEVCKNFFKENGTSIVEAENFFYYYDSVGWKVGGKPVRNWKSLAMSWIRKIKPQPKLKILT